MTTLQVYKEEAHLMGNHFELSVVSDNQDWAQDCIKAGIKEIQRIEKKLTTFSNDSETAKINEVAGIKAVEVSLETIELIERSIKISQITQGAFDITYGSIDKKLWNFDDKMIALPDKETAKKMVRLINYRNIIIDKKESTVFLKEKGMRIGFGGIGKGYAAEMAKKVMRSMGVTSGIVNASGDLTTWGTQPDEKPWTIGIANPNAAHQVFSYLTLTDMAVATSGNYEKYIMIGGKKYSHTIHPKTGLPVTGIKSVTIITPNAEVADAMATPVTIMGIEAGLDMINQINSIEAIIIDDDNRMYRSKNINLT